MKLHTWMEFRGAGRFLIMGLAMAGVVLFWRRLTPGAFTEIWHHWGHGRHGGTFLVLLHTAWFFGWLIRLFGRAQDIHGTTNYDFDSVRKLVGTAMISAAALALLLVWVVFSFRA